MRNISFFLTTRQVVARTKTVTRRNGWKVRTGEKLQAIEKGQGLKKGETVNRLAVIEVVSSRWEPLNEITQEDCIAEGFPELTPVQFVAMYCTAHKGKVGPETLVHRIEFKYEGEPN